ncbi:MAG TPA: PP2C family protein-serine/threonine phosphatase [Gemmatimonadaceae bacterium]|nr:PP2C family protein-serine/threonine phosphatase [Gemmatimonadaceae bacterium]
MIILFVLTLSAVIELRDGWQYALTAPRATPPQDAVWREEIEPPSDRELWYRAPLPRAIPGDSHLVFRSYGAAFDVFVDQQRVYAFREPGAASRLRLHAVAIPGGRFLYVRVPRGSRLPTLGGSPLIASRDDVPRASALVATSSLRDDIEDIALGLVLVVIGIASAATSRVRRRADTSALLWFGVFAALYGARLIAHSALPLLLGASILQTAYVAAWITYVITIPGWLMARALIGDGWRGSLRGQVRAFALFAPVAIAATVVRRDPNVLDLGNNILVVLGGVNIMGNLFLTRKQQTRELRVVLAGSLIFMTFALINNLGALGGREIDETPGFVVFVACLGYAVLRVFIRGERERAALDSELATAREIQRGILPTSMPEVARLRFTARYDPASSVAGDFYDFVAADPARVGVIVADVAGHGIPAALIASMVKVAVSSHARLADDPPAMLHELNATLRRDVRRNFVTATYLWLDMDRSVVTVSNAGHPPPVLIRGEEVLELGPHGMLLGRFAVASYGAETVPLRAGDRIAAWTDGVVEALNARGEQFGEERLRGLLRAGAPADDVVDAVHSWRVESPDADDLTLVVIDVT